MGTTAQGISHVSAQCPNVGSLATTYLKGDIGKVDVKDFKFIDRDSS
jgi:hypothetical protein